MSLTEYLRELRTAPRTLTVREQRFFWVLWGVVALTRLLALSRSALDWDEELFAEGVRNYNVAEHHPHPPGYPLFIALAKLLRLCMHSDFRSLQAVATIAGALLFGALFYLGRELRCSFAVSLGGALLTSVMPTVWYYGGTALSDLPALTASAFAAALLLRAARSPGRWLPAMILVAVTAAIRPQSLFVLAAAAAISIAAAQPWKQMMTAIATGAAIVAVIYVAAAFASDDPPYGFLREIGGTSRYVAVQDSFQNVYRPPLRTLAASFLIHPMSGGYGGLVLFALSLGVAIEGMVRRRVEIAVLLSLFLPTALISWMMLDPTAVNRYALTYVPMYGLLAAVGIATIARSLHRFHESAPRWFAATTTAALTLWLALWTWPALQVVRSGDSPPVEAMRWVRRNVPQVGPQVYVQSALMQHAGYWLPDYHYVLIARDSEMPARAFDFGNIFVSEGISSQTGSRHFVRKSARLWEIARKRYFEVSITPLNQMTRFGEGWYDEERDHDVTWRWMGARSATYFPYGRDGVLELSFHVPHDVLPRPPVVTVTWNGQVIDKLLCTAPEYSRQYKLPSRKETRNELVITTDQLALHPNPGDPRSFGLMVRRVEFEIEN